MKTSMLTALTLFIYAGSVFGDCSPAKDKIKIDGILDEPAWASAAKETEFIPFTKKNVKPVKDQTSFSVLYDKDAVYFGITCYEQNMKKVLAQPTAGLWSSESVEIFLCPTGSPMSFYQFLISLTNGTFAVYWDEFGATQPDPHFAPVWEASVHTGKDFWSIEARIPLSAFNMTRSDLWSSTWKMNIARQHKLNRSYSSWSPLTGTKGFLEPRLFRSYKGFPMKKTEDDILISSASVKIQGRKGSAFAGTLDVDILAPADGKYKLQVNGKTLRSMTLKKGTNSVQVNYDFPSIGKYTLKFGVVNPNGKVVERFYPVVAAFDPLKVTLTSPAYRNNFYPGQKFDRITGKIETTLSPVKLTLTGPGLKEQTLELKDSGSFSFDTKDLQVGTAVLTIQAGSESKQIEIRRLAPSKHMMTWIENGNLMVNGKTTLRRSMYATFYMGGEAFQKKYLSDNMHETLELRSKSGISTTLEPNRLIKGIEAKEAVRDIKPSQKLFDAIDKRIDSLKDKDFAYYYISDEPECRRVSPIYLKHIYDYVSKKDPYHVILSCSRSPAAYLDCADWFEVHPYINPHKDLTGKRVYGREIRSVGNFVDDIAKLNRPDKCVGFCPTIFKYSMGDFPNFREVVCHTYAGMIRGGKSLYPYAYHDLGDRASLYEGTKYIFSSFEALQDFFLHGKRTVLTRTNDYEAVLLELPKEKLLVIVNFTTEPQKVSLPKNCGKFFEFRGNRIFLGTVFELAPQEVIVGTTGKMGEDLPTYAEIQKLVDKQEKERLNRGNLLAPLAKEVIITTSNTSDGRKKMFDGTLDVLAWYQVHNKKYYEISFPKTIPVFTKLRIYGKNVDDVVMTMRKRGEWKKLIPVNTDKSEYMVSFEFSEPMKTVKLHLEFPKKNVELYEIELLK